MEALSHLREDRSGIGDQGIVRGAAYLLLVERALQRSPIVRKRVARLLGGLRGVVVVEDEHRPRHEPPLPAAAVGVIRGLHPRVRLFNLVARGDGEVEDADGQNRVGEGLHGLDPAESRTLTIGFASGRFPFINIPFGIVPRNPVEEAAWPVVKNKIFEEATEIFLRLLNGETLNSTIITPRVLRRGDFRSDADWQRVIDAYGQAVEEIPLAPRWPFPNLKVVPQESRMDLLRLSIGSHDPAVQAFANTILPVGVFNLSITPGDEIEKTNARMQTAYNPDGGGWQRRLMPRTVLVFYNDDPAQAAEEARDALSNYWRALEGTLDEEKVRRATSNALVGDAAAILAQMKDRFHADDRLMLWFDFNNHDSKRVMANMEAFMTKVAPSFYLLTAPHPDPLPAGEGNGAA